MSLLLLLLGGGTTTTLTASKGALTLTGKDAALVQKLNSAKGALTLTGQAATTVQRLLAAKGALTLTGKDATLAITAVLTASNGALTLTGADAALTEIIGTTRGGGGTRKRFKKRRPRHYWEKFQPEVAEVICALAEQQIEQPRVSEPERVEQLETALLARDIELRAEYVEALIQERNRLISAEVARLLRAIQEREDEALVMILAEVL